MTATILTSSVIGLDAHRVDVECDISPGMPLFMVVGLPDIAVQEARERVRSALRHANAPFPRTRITINLAPADLRKAGTHFDLPIAIALLVANEQIPAFDPLERLMIGELALDGRLRPVPGALSTALLAKRIGVKELIIPDENTNETALIPDLKIHPAKTLTEVINHIIGAQKLPMAEHRPIEQAAARDGIDLAGIRGQQQAKRALEIAAAGGHNILFIGPPGSGKTLLARALPSILPDLTHDEAIDVTRIHSVAGRLPHDGVLTTRPFRCPHHTASGIALVGGGAIPKPGEVSLAHRGVLFLDELPEFSRQTIENLRQPLEDGLVTISRAQGAITFPARTMLVAAMNPCPCGFSTDPQKQCRCSPQHVAAYRKRLSGPLLDRIDLMIHVPAVPPEHLLRHDDAESSQTVRGRVEAARGHQRNRYTDLGIFTNAELTSDHVRRTISISQKTRQLLERAIRAFHLSARTYFRLLKVARTIADLTNEENVAPEHVSEALQYRQTIETGPTA